MVLITSQSGMYDKGYCQITTKWSSEEYYKNSISIIGIVQAHVTVTRRNYILHEKIVYVIKYLISE